MANNFDAIVVGSGISGGAGQQKNFAKGLTVLLLKRGAPYEHLKDYKTANLDPWEFKYRGRTTENKEKISRRSPWMGGTGNGNGCMGQ
jgi:choline dehydrogenase-like flavoprotein